MQKSLETYLESGEGAGKIIAHARLLVRLSRLYQELAPAHLGQSSRLANFKSGIVVIHAFNGAIAAKLRQIGPSLVDGFAKRGVECSGVQVKVQVEENLDHSRPARIKPLPEGGGRALERLRDALPDSPLREALNDLLRCSAREE